MCRSSRPFSSHSHCPGGKGWASSAVLRGRPTGVVSTLFLSLSLSLAVLPTLATRFSCHEHSIVDARESWRSESGRCERTRGARAWLARRHASPACSRAGSRCAEGSLAPLPAQSHRQRRASEREKLHQRDGSSESPPPLTALARLRLVLQYTARASWTLLACSTRTQSASGRRRLARQLSRRPFALASLATPATTACAREAPRRYACAHHRRPRAFL